MKKIFIFIFSIIYSLTFAAKTEDMYLMRKTDSGNLFFIFENSFSSSNSRTPLLFDMTYLDLCDTISIKMTITIPTLTDIDSVRLSWNDDSYTINTPYVIYKEKDNKQWTNRLDCVFPYFVVEQAFTNNICPIFTIYTSIDTITYSISEYRWSKLSVHFYEIFKTIQLQKRYSNR